MKRTQNDFNLFESKDSLEQAKGITDYIKLLESDLNESINTYTTLTENIQKERCDQSFGSMLPSQIELNAIKEDVDSVLTSLWDKHKNMGKLTEMTVKDFIATNVYLFEASDSKASELADNVDHATKYGSETLKSVVASGKMGLDDSIEIDGVTRDNLKTTLSQVIRSNKDNASKLEESVDLLTKNRVLSLLDKSIK